MFSHWLRLLRPGIVRPTAAARRRPQAVRRRSSRPALEVLEDRVTPTTNSVVASSFFDSAVYEFNATTGALQSTLVAPYSQSVLANPTGLTVGPDGNLYLSSQNLSSPNNASIVEYNVATQTLSTFINSSVLNAAATANGDSAFAPAGLRFGPDGNLYVSLNGGQSATSGGAVVRFNIGTTNGVLAYGGSYSTIATGLIQPTEMTFGVAANDLDSLYVSDSGAGSVVKITHAVAAAPTSSTFIAAGSGTLNYPSGLTWGSGGKLFVVDLGATTDAGQVLRFNANGTFDGVFATPSTALKGQFPSDAVFNSGGDLLTADLGPAYPPALQGAISEFNPNGSFMKTLVSSSKFPNTGTGTSGFSPSQLTLFAGDRAPTASAGGSYTINEGSPLTLKAVAADPNGFPLTYSWDVNGDGTFGDAVGANPTLSAARLQALGVYGNGTFNVRVMVSDGHGHTVTSAPVTLTVNYAAPKVAPLVASSYFDSAVYEFSASTGKLLNALVTPNSQSVLSGPSGLTVGPDGNLYLSSQNNNSIVEYNVATQTLSTFISSSVLGPIATANGDSQFAPAGLRFGPDGDLYVSLNGGQSATSGGAVIRFNIATTNGELAYGGTYRTVATGLIQPTEMTFGVAANDLDSLYVSDSGAGSVIKIADAVGTAPTSSTFIAAGSGGLVYPSGLTWGAGGKLYVVDLGAVSPFAGQVLRFNANGTFDEVFTRPSTALQAQFSSDAVFNAAGDLLTADLGPTYPPNLGGAISEFNPNGTFAKTLVSSSQFGDTGPGTSGFSPSQLTLFAGDRAPTASAGAGYTIIEGGSLTLKALAANPDGDHLTYSWDINGTLGATTGANPTLGWTKLAALGIDTNGTYTVEVLVSDGHGHTVTSAPVTLAVNYVPPKVVISGAATYTSGQAYTLDLSAKQIGSGNAINYWTITWGDGSPPQQVSGNPAKVTHLFTAGGPHTISATVTNDMGTFDADLTLTVTAKPA